MNICKPKIVYDSDNLIISSFEGMAKFGYYPSDDKSRESLKRRFDNNKMVQLIVHFSCVVDMNSNINIANVVKPN